MTHNNLILASGSPRRQQALTELGITFSVQPADIDETPLPDELPAAYVVRMAVAKALAAHELAGTNAVVLAADTTVVARDGIFGKPENANHARQMLLSLAGGWHTVLTALALWQDQQVTSTLVISRVLFDAIDPSALATYLSTDEPYDKAGAYAIQGFAARWITRIEGSYYAIVGLPQVETQRLLIAAGVK